MSMNVYSNVIMSRILFDAIDKSADLYGRERYFMDSNIQVIGNGLIRRELEQYNIHSDETEIKFIKPDPTSHICKYLKKNHLDNTDIDSIVLHCSIGAFGSEQETMIFDEVVGNFVPRFTWYYNRAMTHGSDPIKMCALIHGSCELHGYILREDFEWFCKVVNDGLDNKIFRREQGWDEVLNLFKETTGDVIVLSYTVTEEFPHASMISDEEDPDWFYDLSYEEQFNRCFDVLSKNEGLRISPDKFDTIYAS